MIKCQHEFDNAKSRDLVSLKCDFCGKDFQRIKRTIKSGRKDSNYDACSDQECRVKKMKQTSFEKYGVDNYAKTQECTSKIKETLNKNWGTDNINTLPEIQAKIKKTCMDRYGVDHYGKTEESIKQKKENCYFKSDEYKKTMKKKYGVSSPICSPELKEKANQSRKETLKEMGVENVSQLPKHKEKAQNTSINKYGKEHYSQTEEYKQKVRQTCFEKYGETHYSKTEEYKKRQKKTLLEKYGVVAYPMSQECKDKLLEKYGVPYGFLKPSVKQVSSQEKEIKDWLGSLGYEFHSDYNICDGKEIDLFNDKLKIGIEYCSLYFHSENSPEPRLKNYHYSKYKKCQEKGVSLITIFSDEWIGYLKTISKNIILSKLGNLPSIFARKCKCVQINKKDADIFCENNHLQGRNHGNKSAFGIMYNNELVGVMCLSTHHRQSDKLVISRLCFKGGLSIVGGASKLLKQAKEWSVLNGYNEIITWSDNRWSDGNVYKKIGFKLDAEMPPDYFYVNLQMPIKRFSKQSQKKSVTGCPKDITEKNWALQQGLSRIWDCGKKRWKINLK
jgi:hypothetical protein